MEWQEKLATFQEIADTSLRMRKPGDWYVQCGLEIASGGMLKGEYGNGATPQEAVEDHWTKYTKPGTEIKARHGRFTWAGSHWRLIRSD